MMTAFCFFPRLVLDVKHEPYTFLRDATTKTSFYSWMAKYDTYDYVKWVWTEQLSLYSCFRMAPGWHYKIYSAFSRLSQLLASEARLVCAYEWKLSHLASAGILPICFKQRESREKCPSVEGACEGKMTAQRCSGAVLPGNGGVGGWASGMRWSKSQTAEMIQENSVVRCNCALKMIASSPMGQFRPFRSIVTCAVYFESDIMRTSERNGIVW